MQNIRIATAQFEHRDNDPAYNLSVVDRLTRQAVDQGARIVCFHEGCVQAYSWVQPLSHGQLRAVAESVPDGPACRKLIEIATKYNVIVCAGLFESDDAGNVYNTYVVMSPDGFVARYRKLHTFVSPHLTPGDSYTVFDLLGWKFGISICYDNNLPENVRMNAMLGAQVVLMPHVTGCLPSVMPGRGVVDRKLWDNRETDPVPLRQEFDGPKGRGWLMRWLPARAFENGVYAVFSNPIGWDYDTVKPGLAMVLDPFGEVIAESRALADDVVIATLTPDRLEVASGKRYISARRPELYDKLVEPHPEGHRAVTLPGWRMEHETGGRDAATAT